MPTPPNLLSSASVNATAGPSLSTTRKRRQTLSSTDKNQAASSQPLSSKDDPAKISAQREARKSDRIKRNSSRSQHRRHAWDGLNAGALAIGIYALMHESSSIMTLLLLAIVMVMQEPYTQRIFLFFLVLLNFAEYFYLLPPALARYQQEDWWDIPTIKTALLTMFIFWSIAWCSACTSNYLEGKQQRLKLDREKRRIEQQLKFQSSSSSSS